MSIRQAAEQQMFGLIQRQCIQAGLLAHVRGRVIVTELLEGLTRGIALGLLEGAEFLATVRANAPQAPDAVERAARHLLETIILERQKKRLGADIVATALSNADVKLEVQAEPKAGES